MVVQKAFNNLKDGPKEDKVAVASGIAISVVVVLLAAWAIYFFHTIQQNKNQLKLGGGVQDQFNFQGVTEAQQQLQAQFGSPTQDYQNIRAEAAQGNNGQMQVQEMQVQGTQTDQFGTQGQ